MIGEILLLIILIFLNAFFSASEIALISLNDNKVKLQADKGNKKAKIILKLLNEPSNFLATIQIGITFAGFLASAFASETFADKIVSLFQYMNIPISQTLTKTIAVIIITVILSYFTLVLGELVPKRLAMQKPEAISNFAAKPLTVLGHITSPFVKFLTASTNFFIKLIGCDPDADEENVSEEEIRMMVDVGEERGAIQEIEKLLINNIFDFDDIDVSEIMTHRIDIESLSLHLSLDEIFRRVNSIKYTRIPVYEGNIDNIVGILHVKDLLKYVYDKENEDFHLNQVMRQPYFIPESKKADELLKEFQINRLHMAVVIDEYGGTAGIITIEDLLEEIVGNIMDEYDEDEDLDVVTLENNCYMFHGTISLDEVEDVLNIKLPVEEYDTLSGYIIGQMGKIPKIKDHPIIKVQDVTFQVEKIEDKRIIKIKASKE